MTSRGQIGSALGILLWVLGGEVFPLAHVAFHDEFEPHDHGNHCHGDACHEHGDADASDSSDDPDHGEGSFAHRDQMVANGTMIYWVVPPRRVPVLAARAEPWSPGDRARVDAPSARAPPVLA